MNSATGKNLQVDTKSPISILQELMIREMERLPIYTLVHNSTGTHLSSFTIKVECKGSSTEGTASSKKEAKQKAAQAMLNLLNKESVDKTSEAVVPVHLIESTDVIKHEGTSVNSTINSVGKLQELCAKNRLDEPHYEIINASGPSHAPTFTLMCTIQTLQEEASARSKKQAKQDVALKMLNRLENGTNLPESLKVKIARVNDEDIDDLVKGIEFMDLSITDLKQSRQEQTNIAKNRYPNLTKKASIVSTKNDGIPISMYHQCFKRKSLILLEHLTSALIEKEIDSLTYDELRIILKISTNILDCQMKEISYKLKTTNLYMVGIQFNFTPQIMEIGYSTMQREAEKIAMTAVMETLLLLLK